MKVFYLLEVSMYIHDIFIRAYREFQNEGYFLEIKIYTFAPTNNVIQKIYRDAQKSYSILIKLLDVSWISQVSGSQYIEKF